MRSAAGSQINDVRFGDTWLKTFKQSYGWRRRLTHGEAGAADRDSVEGARRVIPETLASYDADGTYSADETALMYRHMPQKRIVNDITKATNAKKAYQRITVIHCVNATGSHRMPPQVTIKSSGKRNGKPPRPQSLRKINLNKLGVLYNWNTNAGMTSDLFEEFMKMFKRRSYLRRAGKDKFGLLGCNSNLVSFSALPLLLLQLWQSSFSASSFHQNVFFCCVCRKEIVLLLDGFAGHKPPSDECQRFDVGE